MDETVTTNQTPEPGSPSLTVNPAEGAPELNPELSSQSANQVKAKAQEPEQITVYFIDLKEEVVSHESAELFPMIEGEELEQLENNILAKGQQAPIIMLGNKVIDGRNRLKICRKHGIATKAIQWQGGMDVTEFIIALNFHRRHFTTGQRAAFAVKLMTMLEEDAAKRCGLKSDEPVVKLPPAKKSVDLAGAKFKVSGKYVGIAKKILASSEDTFKKVLNGTLSLPQAQREIKVKSESLSQSEPPRHSLFEALKGIIKLISDESKEKLLKIAEDNPEAIKNALERLYKDGAGHESNDKPEANVDETPNSLN